MKRTSLTLMGYDSDTQVDRLKGIRMLQPSVFSLNTFLDISHSFEKNVVNGGSEIL